MVTCVRDTFARSVGPMCSPQVLLCSRAHSIFTLDSFIHIEDATAIRKST